MAQLFRPAADTIFRVALVSLAVLPFLVVGLAYALQSSPYRTGQSVTIDQPVPFSHKHHVGDLGLDCRYCHTGVTQSRYAGVPPTHTCMTCHSQLWTNAAMLAPVRESLARGVPLRWNRVHVLPGYVYFDHAVHLAKGVGCSECHGPVHEMPLMRQAAPLTMGWCLDCHRNPGPHLRPEAALYDTAFTHRGETEAEVRAYLAHYRIRTQGLTDCSVCHR